MKFVSLGASAYLAPSIYPCPIVFYFHHVGRPLSHYTSLSVETFKALLALLRSRLELASAAELTAPVALTATIEPSKPKAILTFDDGYAETVESVYPILQEAGVTAGFFVPTAHVGRTLPHPTLRTAVRRASWEDLCALRKAGHLVLSHGHTHVRFRTASIAAREINISRATLARSLGDSPDCVAYPFGEWPPNPGAIRVGRAFSTVKAPASHWNCRPDRIRRVYLDGSRSDTWSELLSHWVDLWKGTSCAECYHSHLGPNSGIAENS
jgi:peptidoglycan/xylan/chitin deacetylase (PgdA/CDA1 family)